MAVTVKPNIPLKGLEQKFETLVKSGVKENQAEMQMLATMLEEQTQKQAKENPDDLRKKEENFRIIGGRNAQNDAPSPNPRPVEGVVMPLLPGDNVKLR